MLRSGVLLTGESYLSLPAGPSNWIVPDILPVGGALNLYGRQKAKKSFLALQLAEAIANPARARWLPFPIVTHGPVVYVQLDTPRGIWQDRVKRMTQDGGLDFRNVIFGDKETLPYPFDILGTEGPMVLEQDLRSLQPPPLAIIIDTLREIHNGDENDSGQMKAVVSRLTKLAFPAALVLISHSRKESTAPRGKATPPPDLMSENRGSNYISGRMDCVMRVTRRAVTFQSRTAEESTLGVTFDEKHYQLVLRDPAYQAALDVLQRFPTLSRSSQARELMHILGTTSGGEPVRSEDSCRWLLRSLTGEGRHSG